MHTLNITFSSLLTHFESKYITIYLYQTLTSLYSQPYLIRVSSLLFDFTSLILNIRFTLLQFNVYFIVRELVSKSEIWLFLPCITNPFISQIVQSPFYGFPDPSFLIPLHLSCLISLHSQFYSTLEHQNAILCPRHVKFVLVSLLSGTFVKVW